LCKRIECLELPKRVDYDRKASPENVEVFSSFRPSVSTMFSAEKLEQVILYSETDSEPEEIGRNYSLNGNKDVLCATPTGTVKRKGFNDMTGEPRKNPNKIYRKDDSSNLKSELSTNEYWEDHSTLSAPDESKLESELSTGRCCEDPSTSATPAQKRYNLRKRSVSFDDQATSSSPCKKIMTSIPHHNLNRRSIYWEIGQPIMNEVTVICPILMCNAQVKSYNISKHLKNIHGGQVDSLLCQMCKKPILAADVLTHIPRCFGTYPNPPHPQIFFTLRGLSVLVNVSADDQALAVMKNHLERYLFTNFTCCATVNVSCRWMYMNYQQTILDQGGLRKILSPTKFMLVVFEVAFALWKIDVGPFKGQKRINVKKRSQGMTIDVLLFKSLRYNDVNNNKKEIEI